MLCTPAGSRQRLRNPDGQTDSLGVTQETCGMAGAERQHGSVPSPPDKRPARGRNPRRGAAEGLRVGAHGCCPQRDRSAAAPGCAARRRGGDSAARRGGRCEKPTLLGFFKKPEACEGGMQPE